MRQWSPGLTVVGTLVSDGRRKVFTIYPDGSTEEQEETAASSVFNYLRTTTTLPGGGSWHTIQLTTSLGARLASLLVPRSLAERPLFGRLATATPPRSPGERRPRRPPLVLERCRLGSRSTLAAAPRPASVWSTGPSLPPTHPPITPTPPTPPTPPRRLSHGCRPHSPPPSPSACCEGRPDSLAVYPTAWRCRSRARRRPGYASMG